MTFSCCWGETLSKTDNLHFYKNFFFLGWRGRSEFSWEDYGTHSWNSQKPFRTIKKRWVYKVEDSLDVPENNINVFIIVLLSYTRLSCTLLEWNLYRAKRTIPPWTPCTPIIPSCWMKELTNWWCPSKLNWRQFIPCHNIHV